MKKVVAIDGGYGHTKYKFRDENGVVQQGIFASIVGPPSTGFDVEGLRAKIETIDVEGETFLVGEGAKLHALRNINLREKGWIESKAFKALFKAALWKCAPPAVDVMIMTGLPVNFYQSDRQRLEKIIHEIAETFGCNITVKILPQPVGAFFSLLFNEDGQVRERKLLSGRVGVLDCGYYTTDLVTLKDLQIIEKQTGSTENGVSTAIEAILKDINAEFDQEYESPKDLHEIEAAVRARSIRVRGKDTDISKLVDPRLNELAEEIRANARSIWKGAGNIDHIFLCGGGAALLNGRLSGLYEQAELIQGDPQFANVSGYFNRGEYIVRKV